MQQTRPLTAEMLGTFALVVGCISPAVVAAHTGGDLGLPAIAAANGITVMMLIYAIGEISGAHMNPAVTIAFAVAKRLPWATVPGYVVAQSVGAIAGAATVYTLFGHYDTAGATVLADDVPIWRGIAIEALLSWLLMFVILGVSTGAKEKGLMAGAAVGCVVCLDVLLGGPYTGASMNPARSLGPAVFTGQLSQWWVFVVGPCIGTCLAVACLCMLRPRDCCPEGC